MAPKSQKCCLVLSTISRPSPLSNLLPSHSIIITTQMSTPQPEETSTSTDIFPAIPGHLRHSTPPRRRRHARGRRGGGGSGKPSPLRPKDSFSFSSADESSSPPAPSYEESQSQSHVPLDEFHPGTPDEKIQKQQQQHDRDGGERQSELQLGISPIGERTLGTLWVVVC